MLALGTTLGLDAITKYNSLLLAGLLLVLAAWPAMRRLSMLLDIVTAALGFLATSLWWFVRNKILYGQFLASRTTMAYLKAWLPPLVRPVSWTNAQRFLHFVPSHLFISVWYDGGWNQFQLPKWMDTALWMFAAVCTVLAIAKMTPGPRRQLLQPSVSTPALLGTAGSVLAGIAAVIVIAQTTAQAEGRVGFVGLVGFAFLLVLGTALVPSRRPLSRFTIFAWPLVLVGVNVYVFANFLVPFRGL
jgi:hypothetical protein